jgi:hypothetical protein
MDTNTLLIIIVLVLLLGGGGWYAPISAIALAPSRVPRIYSRRRLIRQASAFLQQVLLTLVASKQGLFGSPNCYGSFLLLLARASCQNFHRIRQDAASIKQNAPTKKKIVSPSRLSNIRLFRS